MNSEVSQTTIDVLDEMVRLAEERVEPRDGVTRLKRRAGMKLDVLWERESVGGAVHYDALVRVPGGGSVSVGYCPDRGMPWALRGSFRWSEVDMLRVNERTLRVDEIVAQLDFLWSEAGVARRIVDSALIWEAIEEDPEAFTPSDEELQEAMNAFRRRRGLFTAEATTRWLEREGMTHRSLETRMEGYARAKKLRQSVVEGREDAYFEAHAGELDVAEIARIPAAHVDHARALAALLRAGEIDVLGAASEALRRAAPRASRWEPPPPLLSRVRRCEIATDRSEAIFTATPGAVLDPVAVDGAWEITVVLAREPAALDDATRAVIRDRLFEAWLAERRAGADIEWLWGHS